MAAADGEAWERGSGGLAELRARGEEVGGQEEWRVVDVERRGVPWRWWYRGQGAMCVWWWTVPCV
jgi:hypothetical protein